MVDILKTHDVDRVYTTLTDGETLQTREGVKLQVRDGGKLIQAPGSSARVVRGPIMAGKTAVYVIDNVLLPQQGAFERLGSLRAGHHEGGGGGYQQGQSQQQGSYQSQPTQYSQQPNQQGQSMQGGRRLLAGTGSEQQMSGRYYSNFYDVRSRLFPASANRFLCARPSSMRQQASLRVLS